MNADSAAIAAASGVLAFGSITDFRIFENLFSSWGPHASSDAFDIGNRGKCNAGAVNCALWDWRIDITDSTIKNTSVDGASTNLIFSPGTACPAQLHGNVTSTDQQGSPNTFLTHATEIVDGIGDDDGLCESGETCLYSPNFGAYQGHGVHTAACTFTSGTVTSVTLKAFPTNGI